MTTGARRWFFIAPSKSCSIGAMANYKPCPECNSANVNQMSFTWWGGLIGPKVLSHVKCDDCGKQFNGKTGNDNTVGIVIYTVVVGLIVLVLLIFLIAVAIMLATMG